MGPRSITAHYPSLPSAYGIALLSVIAAALVRWATAPWLDETIVYGPFLIGTLITAWLAGFGPALVAAILGMLAGWNLFIEEPFVFEPLGGVASARLQMNMAIGVLIALIGGRMHAARTIAEIRAHEIAEAGETLRANFENAPVGIAHNAPDGRWLRINDRLCDIVGHSREELLQKTFADITHPDDLDADWDQAERCLDERKDEKTPRETSPVETEIVMIIDRSGSMEAIAADMEGGIRSFLRDQLVGEGKAFLTACLFDDRYEMQSPGRITDLLDQHRTPRLHCAVRRDGSDTL